MNWIQVATLLTALAAVAAVVFTSLSLRITEQGQLTDRFSKAVEHLGSDKLDVRLGGMYALERIARDSARDHPTIMEVLSGFVREHAPAAISACPSSPSQRPASDAQTALTIIGRRDVAQDRNPLNLASTCLFGANLRNAGLTNVDFSGAVLRNADLYEADLRKVKFIRADLRDAYLPYVDLTYADLAFADLSHAVPNGGNLSNANLTEAKLVSADIANAKLVCASLHHADLSQANLLGADVTKASLQGGKLIDANLYIADLPGADLRQADLTGATLTGADLTGIYHGDTKFPYGFSVPSSSPSNRNSC